MKTQAQAYKITGRDALRLAERDSLQLYCHANPLDLGGPVSIDIGQQIAKDDPSLLFVTVVPIGWWTGERFLSEMPGYNVTCFFNMHGMYLGPDDDGVEPRWEDSQ